MLLTACTSNPPTASPATGAQAGTQNSTVATVPTTEGSTRTTPTRPGTSTPTAPDKSAPRTSTGTSTGPSTSTSTGTCVSGRCYTVGAVHELPSGSAPESSGMAASGQKPGIYLVVDDATGTKNVVAVRTNGSVVGTVTVQGMSARNAEALAAGACGDRAGRCLYVGDIGDNSARRDHITVYRMDDPALNAAQTSVTADAWNYTYPDGPHNAESMMVSGDGSLLVITKSAPDKNKTGADHGTVPPHRIYRAAPGGGVLTYVRSFTPENPLVRLQSLFTGTVVTDVSYAAGRVLLLTYDEIIEYVAPSPNADPATFPTWPHRRLPNPPMIQSEGIAIDVTGCGFAVTSEEGPGGTRSTVAGVSCR